MNNFEIWIHHPAALAIGKTLLYSLWQSAVAGFALAALLCGIRSSRVRYAAACTALLAVVAVAFWTFTQFNPGSETAIAPRSLKLLPRGDLDSANYSAAASARLSLQDALPWLAPLWLAGVLLFNLKHVASWLGAQRMRSRGVCAATEAWQNRLNAVGRRLKVSTPVVLLESCFVQIPVVIGQARPVILLPLGVIAGLPAEQVELILMHELAHVRRYDYAVNLVQIFIEGLMFYNPAVWWISKVIRFEREHCCDDLVIAASANAHAYAAALAALEERRSRTSELVMAATGGSVVNRIRRVLGNQPEVQGAVLVPVLSAVLLIIVTTLVLSKPAQQNSTLTPPPSPALRQWLSQDVKYIVTEAERAAFESLRADAEREQFIEQFWLRRDPTPGTVDNEMKDEHYRRIAYADQHFATSFGVAGWDTDRGRTYIKWGPPDDIESHPAGTLVRPGGARLSFPFELWRYKHIEGLGNEVIVEFVDTNGTGLFRQTIDPLREVPVR